MDFLYGKLAKSSIVIKTTYTWTCPCCEQEITENYDIRDLDSLYCTWCGRDSKFIEGEENGVD